MEVHGKVISIPLCATNRISAPHIAESILERGATDVIFMNQGRQPLNCIMREIQGRSCKSSRSNADNTK
eukprot:13395022-Ditylum_brightwellii.AAC.2